MTALERVTERYQHDAMFRAVVDAMRRAIVDLELSPWEMREAAMFAAYLVETGRLTR